MALISTVNSTSSCTNRMSYDAPRRTLPLFVVARGDVVLFPEGDTVIGEVEELEPGMELELEMEVELELEVELGVGVELELELEEVIDVDEEV